MATESGAVLATTNYVHDALTEAPVVSLGAEDLASSKRFSKAIGPLIDRNARLQDMKLKISVEGDLSAEKFRHVFDAAGQTFKIDTGPFERAELFLKGHSRGYGLERLTRQKPPPRWAAKLNECCVYTGVPPDLEGWDRLKVVPYDPERAQVISLFASSVVERSLATSRLPAAQDVLHPAHLRGDATAAVIDLIAKGPEGSPIVILGHTTGNQFQIELASGATVAFEALTSAARQAKRPLILLGCHTAEHFKLPGVDGSDYAGAQNAFRPEQMAPQIAKAIGGSRNFQELATNLSSHDLLLVMSTDFMREVEANSVRVGRGTILQRMSDGWTRIVGSITIHLPCGLGGVCQ